MSDIALSIFGLLSICSKGISNARRKSHWQERGYKAHWPLTWATQNSELRTQDLPAAPVIA
jgi:hypothetical protein